MCNKTTRTRKQPARRSRTRTRKPKYLSLSKHIKTESDSKSPPPSSEEAPEMPRELKTLFPLHPESSLAAEDRSSGDENVAMLFQADVASDLTGLLQAQTTSSSDRDDASFNHRRSLMYDNEDADSLVKSAMKRNSDERDRSEEKWVCYSEVVEEVTSTSNTSAVSRSKRKSKRKMKMKKEGDQLTTTSSSATTTMSKSSSSPSLALKLDYEGILNAWSDKGSFIVRGEDDQLLSSPQTVPDLHCDLGLTDGWASNAANVWTVPESGCVGIKEETEGLKSEQREASVLRYKEKRQSRLFAKRIRYEVRKLNAEKRPRIKGRFVKIG